MKVAPDAADAYLRLGMANYIIGSLPGTKKFFLGFAGVHGDKKKGIEQIGTAANSGQYLRPFAKILLALTALRERSRKWLAHNLRSWRQSSRETRCLLVSWRNLLQARHDKARSLTTLN